jgi:sugar phosphate isomerase/epimerase
MTASVAPEIIAGYWTIAGPVRPGDSDDVSPWSIEKRVAEAARAGFTGLGFYYDDLVAVDREGGIPRLADTLREYGIRYGQFELGVAQWWGVGAERDLADARITRLTGLIERTGLADNHVKALPELTGVRVDLDVYAEGFALFAHACAEVGAPLGLEFLPYSTVSTAGRALAIVQSSGHPSAGIVIDTWHVARGGTSFDEIAGLPVDRIVNVEIDDVAPQPHADLGAETIDGRRYPGEGAIEWVDLLAAVRATGYERPFGLEVISHEQRGYDLATACRRGYETAAAVLSGAPGAMPA